MAAIGRNGGFTLFEILVILALIGIMLGVIAPRLSRDVGVSARREGLRLVGLLKAARSQAIVTGRPYRVDFTAHGYDFATLGRHGHFRPAKGSLFRARRLPAGARIAGLGKHHAVIFTASGLGSAFHIRVVTAHGDFLLKGDGNGHVQGVAHG